MKDKKTNVCIADISSHIFRNYFMTKNSDISDKEKIFKIVSNTFGSVLKEINALKTSFRTTVFVFDGNEEDITFRHMLSDDYKANRPPKEQLLIDVIEATKEYVKLNGYPLIVAEGVEADDIIASLTKKFNGLNINVFILSGDKDLFQLINNNTSIYDGKKQKLFNIDNIVDSKGVSPEKIKDFLTILGDTADNISGIEACGEKTAIKLLENNTLDELIENPDLIEDIVGIRGKNTIIAYIKDNREKIKLSKKLISLKDDMEFGITLKDLLIKEKEEMQLTNFKKRFLIR